MNWKKFLSSLITVSLVLCTISYSVFADGEYEGMCGDNAHYRYSDSDDDGVNDTVVIWGTGNIKDYECNYLGDRNPFHNELGIKNIIIEEGITAIGDSAFEGCWDVLTVTIPNSVTSIGAYAFYECPFLQSINIPNSVTSIGEYAFTDCEHLQSISIPNSVVLIGKFAFSDCKRLQSIEIPNSVTIIGEYAFGGDDTYIINIDGNHECLNQLVDKYGDRVVINRVTPTPVPTVIPTATPVPTVTLAPTQTPTSESGVGGFVERLYTIALNRPSDPNGKADWVNRVYTQGATGADIARGFLFSPEFLGKDMSNDAFLGVLYSVFFDRAGDQGGITYWLEQMFNGMDKQTVILGFINSTEWANVCLRYGIASGGNGVPNITIEPSSEIIAFATRLYTTCLCRNADSAGLMDWATRLANRQISGSDAAAGFFFSAEFVNDSSIDNAEYINRLYQTFMNRPADQGGFDDWMNRMNNGATRQDVFNGFAGSQEWASICSSYGILK